MKWKRSYEPD